MMWRMCTATHFNVLWTSWGSKLIAKVVSGWVMHRRKKIKGVSTYGRDRRRKGGTLDVFSTRVIHAGKKPVRPERL